MAPEQPKNPLHGLTLNTIVSELVEHYGWEELGRQVKIQCFLNEPSVASSLKFLRKTPWAREKVESFYLWHLRELKRQARNTTPDGSGPE
ncbi:MAG: VF530 family protein [Myxococcota bacterium]